jgi:hypothetical protein
MMIYDILKTWWWWGCCCICFYVWFHCCCCYSVSEFGGTRWRRSIAWIHSLESSERKRCLMLVFPCYKLSTFIYFGVCQTKIILLILFIYFLFFNLLFIEHRKKWK